MIHLGLDAVCWRAALVTGRLDLRGVVEEAVELAASHLQLNLGTLEFAPDPRPASVAALLRDHDLAVRATGGSLARVRDESVAGVAGRLERDLDAAAALGSGSLMVYLGTYRPELLATPGRVAEELDYLHDLLDRAAPLASSRGMRIELENASDFTSVELAELAGRLDSDVVDLFLDVTNPYNVLEDPVAAVRRLAGRANGGHVKDFVLESIYTPDGYHRLGLELLFRLPGEGCSDVPGLLRALSEEVRDRDFHLAIEGLHTDLARPEVKDRLRRSLDFLAAQLVPPSES